MGKPIIEFNISKHVEGIFDKPEPARNNVPEWWKKQARYHDDGSVTYNAKGEISHTIKRCMPVMDAMTTGYVIKLPSDLVVIQNNGNPEFVWGYPDWSLIAPHDPEQVSAYPKDDRWHWQPLKFVNPWAVRTPKGYSCLFTAPLHGDKLPFHILSGVVDTDVFNVPVNFPFFIEKGFEGTIPAGTPIVQVIPFKREEWDSEYKYMTNDDLSRYKSSTRFVKDRYMKFFRQPKNFS
jgi:hypothetical protein